MQQFEVGSLSEQVAQHIAEQIIIGELVEGERIQELRIAKSLSVSRGSVREALLLLQRTQLIHIYPHRGAVVAEMSACQVAQLFESGSLILGKMVQLMSMHWHGYHFTYLKQLLSKLDQHAAQGHIEKFYDALFYGLLTFDQMIENSYLMQVYKDLVPAFRRCYFLTLNTSKHELNEANLLCKHTVDAILSRNSQQATLFMYDFCRHLRNLVLESLTRMKQIELAWVSRSRH